MKKILILILVVTSTISFAQESVSLRLKYNKGDVYSITMNQSMNSSVMMMGNVIEMEMSILDKKENIYTSETKISKMVVDIMQGEMEMSFDSTMKDEDLDEMGMMMKSQIAPILKVVTTNKMNELGKLIETKIEPNLPGADQIKSQSIQYPEKAVKVGDIWTDEVDVLGTITSTEYKVTKITNTNVELAVSGKVSGLGSGSINGTITIERATGIPIKSEMKSEIDAGGQVTNVKTVITMAKK